MRVARRQVKEQSLPGRRGCDASKSFDSAASIRLSFRGWEKSTMTLHQLHDRVSSCQRCGRLRSYCQTVAREKRRAFADWEYWGRPVPGFGDPNARIWILGLAPAAHG